MSSLNFPPFSVAAAVAAAIEQRNSHKIRSSFATEEIFGQITKFKVFISAVTPKNRLIEHVTLISRTIKK
jgi:hypothetical protein